MLKFAGGFFFLVSIAAVSVFAETSPVVDQTPVLVVGRNEVSQYLVDKYYKRFSDESSFKEHHRPTALESDQWLTEFVSKEVVIGHAMALGYADRPEVHSTVDRMERYMLTQPSGPFYQSLFQKIPAVSDAELEQRYQHSGDEYDLVLAHFASQAQAEVALGADFSRLAPAQQLERLTAARNSGATAGFHDGKAVWPFAEFITLADIIPSAQVGQCTIQPGSDGIDYIFVRSVTPRAGQNFAQDKERFRGFVTHIDQQIFSAKRSAALKRTAQINYDESTAGKILTEIVRTPTTDSTIPALNPTWSNEVLIRYRVGDRAISVSAADFRTYFNGLFIRRSLHTAEDLRNAADERVVEDLNFNDALRSGVREAPKFVEDRKGFFGFQVLDLFEREVLLPKQKIDPQEVARYYDAHHDEFTSVSKVSVKVLNFTNGQEAARWVAQSRKAPGLLAASAIAPKSESTVEVTAQSGVAGVEIPPQVLLQCAVGEPLGPIQRDGAAQVLIKTQNLETTTRPLAVATASIQKTLSRKELDHQEVALAEQLSKELSIQDHIDRARYHGAIALAGRP